MSTQSHPPLQRPTDRVIAGVCHGLGDYFDVDPVVVRLAFVLMTIAGGAGVLAYIILWVIMPPAGQAAVTGPGGVGAGVRTMAAELKGAGRDVRTALGGDEAAPPATAGDPTTAPAAGSVHSHYGRHGNPVMGLGLVVVGAWLLLGNLGLLDWASARYVWPVFLIALGLALLVRRLR